MSQQPRSQDRWPSLMGPPVWVALGLTGFLAVFQPFGIEPQSAVDWTVLLASGLVNFLVMVLVHALPRRLLGLPRGAVAVPAILAVNFVYFGVWAGGVAPGPLAVQILLVATLTLLVVFAVRRHLAQGQALTELRAAQAVAGPARIRLRSATGDQGLQVAPGAIIAMRAEGNYVEVIQLQGEALARHWLRGTLTEFLEQVPVLARAHRSWAIHPDHVMRYSGGAHGLRLEASGGLEVPVSRAHVADIRARLAPREMPADQAPDSRPV